MLYADVTGSGTIVFGGKLGASVLTPATAFPVTKY